VLVAVRTIGQITVVEAASLAREASYRFPDLRARRRPRAARPSALANVSCSALSCRRWADADALVAWLMPNWRGGLVLVRLARSGRQRVSAQLVDPSLPSLQLGRIPVVAAACPHGLQSDNAGVL